MYNLRHKIILILVMLISGMQITRGDIDASHYYANYTRTFLGYLGHKNPSRVPIKKMTNNDMYHTTKSNNGLYTAGYTDGKTIYLNEDFFARNHPEGINIFTCAHEAVHYAFKHSFQKKRNRWEIEKEADIIAAQMLCKYNYTWVVKQKVAHLEQLVNNGQGHLTDGEHPTIQEQYAYLSMILQPNHEIDAQKINTEDIQDLFEQFKNLSHTQKIIILATVFLGFIHWNI